MYKLRCFILSLSFLMAFLYFHGTRIDESIAKSAITPSSIGPTVIVFKNDSRYNAFVQGKFERFFNTRIIEFPIGRLAIREILEDIKEYGLKVNYLVLVDIKE